MRGILTLKGPSALVTTRWPWQLKLLLVRHPAAVGPIDGPDISGLYCPWLRKFLASISSLRSSERLGLLPDLVRLYTTSPMQSLTFSQLPSSRAHVCNRLCRF